MDKRFVAYFYCNGADISLGVSICLTKPNIEIHVPFGFFRIGWEVPCLCKRGRALGHIFLYNTFGWNGGHP